MKLFVLDPHTIYRRGMVACLESMPGVEAVTHVATIDEAWQERGLLDADLVILDPAAGGGGAFIRNVDARVIVCSSDPAEDAVAAIQAGAVGYLRKDTLTVETLGAAVAAAANGPGVMEPELLGSLMRRLPAEPGRPAARLRYSERTVKNVLHDVVTKLNARSRSQAVAFAVRDGLI